VQPPRNGVAAVQEDAQEDRLEEEREDSIASGWPTTAPVRSEKSAQFVPNWNSIGIPVTTPMAKFTAKIRAQKRAARSYSASCVRNARSVYQATNGANPIVPIGNR